jgi:hypothetical protein
MASNDSQSTIGAAETALYIAGLAKELRSLAAKADLGFLSYLLSMVESEAEETARNVAEKEPGASR